MPEDNLPRILTTYEIVTPESAEHGDAEERGWIDDQGVVIEPDSDYDDDDQPDTVAAAAARFILEAFATEPSCSAGGPGTWYTCHDHETDYSTGAVESRSYHLKGFTPEQEAEVYRLVTSKLPGRYHPHSWARANGAA